ncbi:MAG TPA: hypothetical protein DCY80_18850, partial [Solibacterales bacterium]|nr:hypothetical protein [Bryobacterales bacterium]
LIIQWIDPRTGKPWRTEPDELTPKTEGTNPATPTKQEPESRQVRRRRERRERRSARKSGGGRDRLPGA